MHEAAETPAQERAVRRRYQRFGLVVVAATLVCGALLAAVALTVAGNAAHLRVEAAAREAIALQSETLSGVLEKYRLLPPLLSRREDIAALFDDPYSEEGRAAAQAKASEVANFSGAKDVAFADPAGRIFASARGIFDNSRLDEPALMQAARQGRLGRETMSPDENERAYVFASSVRRGERRAGAIAIYVRMDQIEQTWSLSTNPIAVTDASGTVFVSNRAGWRLRPLFGRAAERAVIAGGPAADGEAVRVAGDDGGRFIVATRELPLMGWTLHVFADRGPIAAAQRTAALVAMLAALLTGSLAFFLVKRRETLALREVRARATAQRLEHLVAERTADLTSANVALAHEVRERRETEDKLRKTQNELIQAAKLAALGQMSATLSHEYNQPLAAIRTYADNATELMRRGRGEAATEALSRIAGLVERMSELSRTLLTFARKPGTSVVDVALVPVVDEALMLVGPRARKAGVRITRQGIAADLVVRGGQVRLTQVLVNLLSNALDALTGVGAEPGVARPAIVIRARRHRRHVALTVEDNGPGIPEDLRGQVLEPFYSTKGVGEGLGIGLAIVYNIVAEFGGRLRISAAPGGGARVTVLLVAAKAAPRELAQAS